MLNVSEVINEITGSGLTQEELFDISRNLTEFTISREKLKRSLASSFDQEELNEILTVVNNASLSEEFMAKLFSYLSPREKQCYVMHTVELKPLSLIAKELGVGRSTVQKFIERARFKIMHLKQEDGRL